MKPDHKKLIEDAVKKELGTDFTNKYFVKGATYILDNLQLFGLVTVQDVKDILEKASEKLKKDSV